MSDYEKIKLALSIAKKAHIGQLDKAGVDYIYHPITVSLLCNTTDEKVVALLHDVVEDTGITFEELESAGISKQNIASLRLLTHSKEIPYDEYIDTIINSGDDVAINVKIADLTHNLDIDRLGKKPPKYDVYVRSLNKLKNCKNKRGLIMAADSDKSTKKPDTTAKENPRFKHDQDPQFRTPSDLDFWIAKASQDKNSESE